MDQLMKYYIIKNKRTGKVVSGTDYRYYPHHQRYADEYHPPLLLPMDPLVCETTMTGRGIRSDRFKLEVIEIGEIPYERKT